MAPPLAAAVADPPIAVVAVAAAESVPRDVYRLRPTTAQRFWKSRGTMFAVGMPIASSILLMASWPRAWASLISCLAIPVVVMDSVAESCSPPPIIDHVFYLYFRFSAFRVAAGG